MLDGKTLAEPGNRFFTDADVLAAHIIEKTGGDIRLALPLGLGKANSIANALTRAAVKTPSINLKILTALTLQRPEGRSTLERRFLEPAAERLFGRYEPLQYGKLIDEGRLPPNITVSEFFFQAGRWLGNDYAQRHYISANYTHAFRCLMDFRPNVVAQLLATDEEGQFSLSCNTDISSDLIAERSKGNADFLFAGEINPNLPFMGRDAVLPLEEIDCLLSPASEPFELFSVIRRPVDLSDLAIGLHVSRLVPDGGTLQIGIGSIGDAIAKCLMLRDAQNDAYRKLLANNPFSQKDPESHLDPFDAGLYCVTEMLVGGILELFEAGIIRREVDGVCIHAGFFLECRDFYLRLKQMPAERRDRISMMPVSFTNSLYGNEETKRSARQNARFINNAMIATCLGAVVSDATEEGQVVSGVGGQFNFVEQAIELENGRSIITLNATRTSGGKTVSNIRWSYGHESVPRHFRDIIVTEYGVADLRGKSDEACIIEMLNIADSRFQGELLLKAKRAGKIRRDHEIPDAYRSNLPDSLNTWLAPAQKSGLLPEFPFGTDFTPEEQQLLPALSTLKDAQSSKLKLASLFFKGLRTKQDFSAPLGRLKLDQVHNLEDFLLRPLVKGALADSFEKRAGQA
jgi:hypothetical protein